MIKDQDKEWNSSHRQTYVKYIIEAYWFRNVSDVKVLNPIAGGNHAPEKSVNVWPRPCTKDDLNHSWSYHQQSSQAKIDEKDFE